MKEQRFTSVISGCKLTGDECLVAIKHAPKIAGQENVNDQHAYLFVEEYQDNEKVRLAKFHLTIRYDVNYIITNKSDYVKTIAKRRETANHWAEGALAVSIIINKDTGASHILSAKDSILWDHPTNTLTNEKLKTAIGALVESCQSNKSAERRGICNTIGQLYTLVSNDFFSAKVDFKQESGDSLEAHMLYDQLCGGRVMDGKEWVLPKQVAEHLYILMAHSEKKHFDYNLLGNNSIFSKMVDRTLEASYHQAEAISNSCVKTVGKICGDEAANMARMALAPSGHNCISLVIEIVTTAIRTYIGFIGKPTESCLEALSALTGGAAKYFATVTTSVLKQTEDVCGADNSCNNKFC